MQEPTRWIPFANLLLLLCFGQALVTPRLFAQIESRCSHGESARTSGVEEIAIGVEWLLHVHKSY